MPDDIGAWMDRNWDSDAHAVGDFSFFGRAEQFMHPGDHPYPQPQPQEETVSVVTDTADAISIAAAHLAELTANPLLTAIAEAGLGLVLTPAEVAAVASLAAALEAGHSASPAPAETQVMA